MAVKTKKKALPGTRMGRTTATSLLRHPVLGQYVMSYPVPVNEVICEGHAEVCRLAGHATWTVDGKERDICPRCAAIKTSGN